MSFYAGPADTPAFPEAYALLAQWVALARNHHETPRALLLEIDVLTMQTENYLREQNEKRDAAIKEHP